MCPLHLRKTGSVKCKRKNKTRELVCVCVVCVCIVFIRWISWCSAAPLQRDWIRFFSFVSSLFEASPLWQHKANGSACWTWLHSTWCPVYHLNHTQHLTRLSRSLSSNRCTTGGEAWQWPIKTRMGVLINEQGTKYSNGPKHVLPNRGLTNLFLIFFQFKCFNANRQPEVISNFTLSFTSFSHILLLQGVCDS